MSMGRLARATLIAALGVVGASAASATRTHHGLENDVNEYVTLSRTLAAYAPDLVASPVAAGGSVLSQSPAHADTAVIWPTLAKRARTLADHLMRAHGAGPGRTRIDYLARQARALAANAEAADGQDASIDVELAAMFGVTGIVDKDLDAISEPHATRIRAELDALLPGTEPLAARLARFESRVAVAPSNVPAVMARALAECRRLTAEHIVLPARESVSVEYVQGRPWSGYSRYDGGLHSTVQVNLDFPLTVDRILNLACHEGYPGHHVHSLLRERRNRSEAAPELDVFVQRSPESFAAEAIAGVALAVVFSADERAAFEQNVLFPLAHLDPELAVQAVKVAVLVEALEGEIERIAHRYLAGALTRGEAARRLAGRALMAHPQATLRFLEANRGYALAYTLGKRLVAEHLDRAGRTQADSGLARWTTYAELATSLQLPTSDPVATVDHRPRPLPH